MQPGEVLERGGLWLSAGKGALGWGGPARAPGTSGSPPVVWKRRLVIIPVEQRTCLCLCLSLGPHLPRTCPAWGPRRTMKQTLWALVLFKNMFLVISRERECEEHGWAASLAPHGTSSPKPRRRPGLGIDPVTPGAPAVPSPLSHTGRGCGCRPPSGTGATGHWEPGGAAWRGLG